MNEPTTPAGESELNAGDHSQDHPDGAHRSHKPEFLRVFLGLCVLTGISFAVANSPLMEQPLLAWSGMILVSLAKAFLVISYFMHLRWETSWKYILTIPASIMSLLIALVLVPDIMLRTRHYDHDRMIHSAEPNSASYAMPADHDDAVE